MRIMLIILGCMLTVWAMAQSLPLFDVARFDQVSFGSEVAVDQASPAIPVSLLPTWALLLLAMVLWSVAIAFKLISPKERKS